MFDKVIKALVANFFLISDKEQKLLFYESSPINSEANFRAFKSLKKIKKGSNKKIGFEISSDNFFLF